MSATHRLQSIQQKLEARGVTDVRIMFASSAHALPASDVRSHVADFLGRYLAGDYGVLEAIGDRPLGSTTTHGAAA